jgi:transcriptional regulator with XRE-family HTH domain
MLNTFACNLLKFREEKRYTQSYMALHSGMSQPNYSDIERGKTNPSVSQLKRFAEVLEISVDELISESNGMKNDAAPSFPTRKKELTETDKDIYIKILEGQLRTLLIEKDSPQPSS